MKGFFYHQTIFTLQDVIKSNRIPAAVFAVMAALMYFLILDPLSYVPPVAMLCLALGFGFSRFQQPLWFFATVALLTSVGTWVLLSFPSMNYFMMFFYPIGLPLLFWLGHELNTRLFKKADKRVFAIVTGSVVLLLGTWSLLAF